MVDWDKIRHFDPEEWGKDPHRVAPALVYTLDEIRHQAGVKIIIHVAWDDGGHSQKSYHYTGLAVDWHFDDPDFPILEQFALISSFPDIGGIGFYPGWKPYPGWHTDLRVVVPRLLWTRRGGKYFYGSREIVRAMTMFGDV